MLDIHLTMEVTQLLSPSAGAAVVCAHPE